MASSLMRFCWHPTSQVMRWDNMSPLLNDPSAVWLLNQSYIAVSENSSAYTDDKDKAKISIIQIETNLLFFMLTPSFIDSNF
jgi:hypothetical protein